MRYICSVLLDGFYAAVAAKEGGITAIHRAGQIIDATPEARERGVGPGMGLREARSILSGEGHLLEWEEETYAATQKRWLRIVAKYSDVVEPVDQHEAFLDLSAHPRPRETAARLVESLASLSCRAQVGIGSCRWIAKLAAIRPDHLGQAISDPKSYVARLPIERLPIAQEHAATLGLLGYRTAAEVAALPDQTLRGLFDRDAIGIHRATQGEGDARVEALFPPNTSADRFIFEGGAAENRQTIDLALERLAKRIGADLRETDRTGKRMDVFLEFEDSSVQRLSRTFARALATPADVLNGARLVVSATPERPVESIRIRLPELAATKRVQLDLQGGRSKSDRVSGVNAAIGQIRGLYGSGAVILAKDKEEPRWLKVQRAYQEANGYVWSS